ncbi:MAG: tRNA preQ1(34) S-adenosylmethionine ribosyltransferase-isomerase QueA [Microcoleaceae cyanobacterium]
MTELDWCIEAYDYQLPQERIAQNPVKPRDSSRLMVVDSLTDYHHSVFRDLPDLLRPGDLLVLNNTRVIPARLYGRKTSGAQVEILLMKPLQDNCWLALVKPGKRFITGAKIEFESHSYSSFQKLVATVLSTEPETGGRVLQFDLPDGVSLVELLDRFGHVPFPPYITDSQALTQQYQTIYGNVAGAIAAPTAGLHFTNELLERLRQHHIEQAFVTLHVGLGTFRPVEVENITTHDIHSEWVEVSQVTVDKIRHAKARGGRVIAVGTTVVRALEGAALANQSNTSELYFPIVPFSGDTKIFIYPGYKWQIVEGLITNFHLPRSSLLMLVSAMIGRKRLLSLYQDAIAKQYRFYSFGDAMLILPPARIS